MVIVYCRVSTDDQNVRQQVNYTKEWFLKAGYEVVRVVSDKESGRLPLIERKRFNKVLKDCLALGCSLGIYNLDRLTRNWDDVTLIEKHFRENWEVSKLISTSDPIDLSNASGRLMFRIRMATSCFMPEDMFEKQRIGIERAKAQGKYKGGVKGRSWKCKG